MGCTAIGWIDVTVKERSPLLLKPMISYITKQDIQDHYSHCNYYHHYQHEHRPQIGSELCGGT
jgi:hypothetical protein